MNACPLVSVIVPCYNYAQFLGEALESVLGQNYDSWECIIVNDGSPDNTEQVALDYCRKDSRFRYLYKENGGHSSARNMGIRHAAGKYILPLDADDKIAHQYLGQAVNKLEEDSSLKLVTGQVQYFGDMNEKCVMPPFDLRSYLIVNYISISSVFRRTDFEKTGGFDETMFGFEDWDLFIKILKKGGKVIELPSVALYYRKKKDSVFYNFVRDPATVSRDLIKLYINNIDAYEAFFPSPVHLIQENEKMNQVINSYQQTKTYRFGLIVHKVSKKIQQLIK